MMNTRAVTAGMIRAAGKAPASSSAELTGFLNTMADTLGTVLKEFTAAPVRIEPDGLSITVREAPLAESVGVRLASPRGPLAPALVADRMLAMALCEAAFGGSGTEAPFDGADRPLSKTERRLCDAALTALAAKLPEALALSFGIAFGKAEDEERKPPSRETVQAPYIAGRLLVYVFGYSGELTILLPEEEAAVIVAAARNPAARGAGTPQQRQHYMQALQDTQVEITALLPAEMKPLGEMARLRRGQLLQLMAGPATPALLIAEGRTLHRARMRPCGEGVTLEIVES